MDSIFEYITSPEIEHSEDNSVPELEGGYRPDPPPVTDSIEELRNATLQTQQAVTALIQQNQGMANLMQQNQAMQAHLLEQRNAPSLQPPAKTGEVDWNHILGGGSPTPAGQAAPAPTIEQIHAVANQAASQALQRQQTAFQQMQSAAQQYDDHFQKNHTDLMPYYEMVKDRFGTEVRTGADMGTAYNNAVKWAYQMREGGYLAKTPKRPAQVPGGGSGGGGWVPNSRVATDRPTVKDAAGQVYPVERYMGRGSEAVPLVDYPEDYERNHLKRYADYKGIRQEIFQHRLHPDALKAYPEHALTAG